MTNNTEQTILTKAREHFVRYGFAATRMQDIADAAEINKAMLHYYFRSKEKLYLEILSQTLNTMVPMFANAMGYKGTFWEKVDKLVETYVSTLIDQPDLPLFIMSELSQQKDRFVEELKKQTGYFPAVQSFLLQMQQEMEAGNIRKVDPMHLFLNIIGMTVFPFIAKPIFVTVFEVSNKDFDLMMSERKNIILGFLRNALDIN